MPCPGCSGPTSRTPSRRASRSRAPRGRGGPRRGVGPAPRRRGRVATADRGPSRAGPATQDLPPVPPAVAGLLCDDFELPPRSRRRRCSISPPGAWSGSRRSAGSNDLPPAGSREADPADHYERRVLETVGGGVDGVVPADALTTGTEARPGMASGFAKRCRDRRTRGLTGTVARAARLLLGVGPFAAAGSSYSRAWSAATPEGRRAAPAITGGVAGDGAADPLGHGSSAGRWPSCRRTTGSDGPVPRAAAHLREDEKLDDLSPAAV